MVNKFIKIFCINILLLSLSAHGAEYEEESAYMFFVGGDVLEMETELSYDNGTEFYDYIGTRMRIGVESKNTAVGLEYIPSMTDEKSDPWGNPYSLESGDSYGIFATLGSPVYFRVGWSSWDTRYKDITSGVSNWQRSSTLDYGLGFKVPLGSYITIYGEYVIRNTEVNYSDLIVGVDGLHRGVDHNSELTSVGVYFSF